MANNIAPRRVSNARKASTQQSLTSPSGTSGIVTPVMASYDGVYSASFRYPIFSLDKLLAQKGWQLPEDMLTSAWCRAPFNLKRYAILSGDWQIVPAVTDPMDSRHAQASQYADFVRWCLTNITSEQGLQQDFRAVLFEMLRACWDGFRVSEIGYQYLEDGPYLGQLGYQGFYAKHAKQIGFDIDPRTSQVRHLTSYTPGSDSGTSGGRSAWIGVQNGGEAVTGGYNFDIPVERCALYTYNPDANLPHGMGDWRGCYKHWWALDNINRFWVKALERWGSPVLIAEASAGNNVGDVATTLDKIRDGASAALPANVKAQIVQAASGVFDGYRLASQYHGTQIALNIQHNTLTTSEGARTGSMALGEVHQDTADDVYDFVARDVEGVVNTQIILRLCLLNFANFDRSLCPRLSLGKEEVGDRYNLAQMFDLMIADGVIWKKAKFIREELGLPPLDEAEAAGIEADQKAQQEAQQRVADARNSGQVKALNALEQARALDILTRAISARMEEEKKAA